MLKKVILKEPSHKPKQANCAVVGAYHEKLNTQQDLEMTQTKKTKQLIIIEASR